jgi:hypothetical protein
MDCYWTAAPAIIFFNMILNFEDRPPSKKRTLQHSIFTRKKVYS